MGKRRALRVSIFIVGGLETLAFLGMLLLLDPFGSSDPLGRSIAVGLSLLLSVPYAALVAPALVLAARDRFLRFALALTILAPVVAILAWRLA